MSERRCLRAHASARVGYHLDLSLSFCCFTELPPSLFVYRIFTSRCVHCYFDLDRTHIVIRLLFISVPSLFLSFLYLHDLHIYFPRPLTF